MKITDTTALNVLCRYSERGADGSDFFHSKVFLIHESIHRLRNKGYRIRQQGDRYFIDVNQVRERALARRKHGRAS